MNTIEDCYEFLRHHNLVEKVLEYNTLYPYTSPKTICTNNPLDELFCWGDTPESDDYWLDLHNSYPMDLTPTSIEDILIYLHTATYDPELPYEFW